MSTATTQNLVRWTKLGNNWCVWSRTELPYNAEVLVTKMNGATRTVRVGEFQREDQGGYVYLVKKNNPKPAKTPKKKRVFQCPECGGKLTRVNSLVWHCEKCGPGFGNPFA